MTIPWRAKLLFVAAAAYFALLWPAALLMPPENDLWWMLPTMSHYLEGRSAAEMFRFLADSLPVGFAQPTLKVFLYAVSRLLGPEVRWLILSSMVVQVANAAMLFLLARRWGISPRAAGMSAALFLTFFGHFHAVFWPTASQHLLALTTILALLNLYFWIEGRLRAGGSGAGGGFAAVGLLVLAASLQRSTVLAMAVIVADILFFSRDEKERAARFRRWSWTFFLYALYPIVALTQSGDPVVTEGLRKLPIPDWVRALVVTDPLFPSPVSWKIRAILLAGLVIAVLGAVWAVLRSRWGGRLQRAGLLPWLAAGAVLLFLGALKDHRQALFAYNAFVPFLTPFSALLNPLRTAFEMDSVEPYYYLAPQVSAGMLLLASAALASFCRSDVVRNRKLALLFVWYGVTLGVTLHQSSSFPLRTPSRYLIYLSPLVCIVVACGLEKLSTFFRVKRAVFTREAALYGVVALLCLSNLVAIRLALFRGRMANAFLFYDDLRTVRILRDDALETGEVRVRGVVRMPIREVWRDFPLTVPADYDNLAVAASALGAGSLRGSEEAVKGAGQAGVPLYQLEGARVLSPVGHPVEHFEHLLMGGWSWIKRFEWQKSVDVLTEAIESPPFLIRYLTQGGRVTDLRWATGALDLEDWLSQMAAVHRELGQPEPEKLTRVEEITREEARLYTQTLVLLAYAHHRLGNTVESQHWLSLTQLFFRDPGVVVHDMNKGDYMTEDLKNFLRCMEDPLFLLEPWNQKKEDYAVGRFLLRLILGLDIRSSWDRRFSKTL